ncbi:TPA: flagellar basal body L-ring protein FlgH, partial [Vibrio parahaemolyticus]|nr:flagellar basal body L-ring protein FlgH [Vibrio parahaemolyticus]
MMKEKAMKWLSKSWAVAVVLLVGCAGRQEFIPPQ